MSRHRIYTGMDESVAPDGDAGFVGVDARRDPRQLEEGLVAGAINKTFSRGIAQTRPGMHTINGWGNELAKDFNLTFREDNYDLYGLLDATEASIGGLNYRVQSGITFQLRCRTTNLWHSVWIQMQGGKYDLAIDPIGVSTWTYAAEGAVESRNYRLWMDRTFQLRNPDTGLWHTLMVETIAGIRVLAVEQTGVATADTYDPVGDANWMIKDDSTFMLALAGGSTWHSLFIELVGGAPALAIDHSGVDEDGFDFNIKVGFGKPYGTLVFSDPYGQEGILVAVSSGVYRILPNNQPQMVYLDEQEAITGPVRMVQAFDRVIMFRGEDLEPLEWNPTQTFADGLEEFVAISQTDARGSDDDNTGGLADDGTIQIPNASDATLFGNRLWIPTGRDDISVSDVLDYTRYSEATQRFKINAGSDDQIVRIFPFGDTTLIVFKDQSIHLLTQVYGNLQSMQNDLLTGEYGAIGRDAIVAVGKDVWFLSEGGLFMISQALDNRLQANNAPVSAPIQPILDRVNWSHASAAQMTYFENKVYIAIPLDGATYNNAILVFDFLTTRWSGYWTGEYVDVYAFVRSNYGGRRRLMAVMDDHVTGYANGSLWLMGDGLADHIYGAELDIEDELVTRGYAMTVLEDKAFGRVILDLSGWYAGYTVEAVLDGEGESVALDTIARDRTKWFTWGKTDYEADNSNDDGGDPYREDYSVVMDSADSLLLFDGYATDRLQRTQDAYRVGRSGQYCQIRVRGSRGRVNVHAILQEARTDRRGEGARV